MFILHYSLCWRWEPKATTEEARLQWITTPLHPLSSISHFSFLSLISFHRGPKWGGRKFFLWYLTRDYSSAGGKMKGINKEKIEFLQPLQEGQPMNQWNKFPPRDKQTWYFCWELQDRRDRCQSDSGKVQGAPDRKKRSRLRNQESLWPGGLYSLSDVMKIRSKAHTQMPSSRTSVPEIYSLMQKAIKREFWSTNVSQHLVNILTAHQLDLQELHATLECILN